MPGPVFLHFQTYARKGSKGGNSVAQVIGEALRDPTFSTHVETPKPPRVLQGDPSTFQADHDAHVADRATEVRVKGAVRRRAIRQDRHTLATIIASYPLTHEQIDAGGDEARAHLADWEGRTVAWVTERYGDQVRVVLGHDDEPHPHLHFWMLPGNADADATMLHPGKQAKKEAEAKAKAAEVPPREAVKAGNKALKDAMRGVIDEYHAAVGVPLGMTRDGPKRRRLSRVQWQAEKDQAQHQAAILRQVETVDAKAAAVIAAADQQASAKAGAFEALAREIEAGTLKRDEKGKMWADDPASLQAGGPEVVRAARAILPILEAAAADRAAAAADRATAAAELVEVQRERRLLIATRERIERALKMVLSWGPRVRRVIQDAEAAAQHREAARDVRANLVRAVPPLRQHMTGTQGIMDRLRRQSPAPEDPLPEADGGGPGFGEP